MRAQNPTLFVCWLGILLLQSCTTTTTMTTMLPHTALVVDEHNYGPVPTAGIEVEAPAGFAPLAWRLLDGETVVAQGAVQRTEPQPGVVAAAITAAACCVPGAVAAGFCLANPALIAAPLTCLVAGPGVFVSALQAPGWLSIPLACSGAAAGSTPLLLGLVGQAPPPQAVLERQTAPPTPTSTSAPLAALAEVPW